MSLAEPNLQSQKVNWLPQRYRVERVLEQQNNPYQAVIAVDRVTDEQVFVESLPAEQFGANDVFRLEQFFNVASDIVTEFYVAPIDWGRSGGSQGERLYWVRPQVAGESFKSVVLVDDRLSEVLSSPAQKRLWLRQLLSGVQQLHEANLTQQDFRLNSILFDGQQPRLLAPGLRFFAKPKYRGQAWSITFGQTASPELLGLLEHDVNQQSDIYSIGVILYCLAQKRLPFEGDTLGEVLSQHLTREIEIHGLCADGCNLLRVAKRMLEKTPAERYHSVKSVVDDLDWLDAHADENQSNGDSPEPFVAGRSDLRGTLGAASFIGRELQIGEIRNAVDQINSGQNRTILVTGESGIGKTRLITEALRDAHTLGIEVYRTEAIERRTTQTPPPLTRLINGLKLRPEIDASFGKQLIEEKDEICNFFPEFAKAVGLYDGEAEHEANSVQQIQSEHDSESSFEFNRLCRATCSVLSKLSGSQRPAVIWIDDCQYLDANTIEALKELSRWKRSSLLLVLSARTSSDENPTSQSPTARFDFPINASIHAGPLDDEVVSKIINSMAYGLPQEAVAIAAGLAAGSPLMAEALMRGMLESGALFFGKTSWHVDTEQLNNLQASSGASEALLMRLQQFPSQVLELLSVAAIMGKSFALDAVCALTKTSMADCHEHMDWARRQRIVWIRPDGQYSFLHDHIRNALVMRLPENEQRSLHVSMAEHIEIVGGSLSEAAIHFDQGGVPQRAVSIAVESAKKALRSSTFSTALQMFQIAWRGLGENDFEKRSYIAENIGRALMLSGLYDDGDLWFDRAATFAVNDLDRARVQMRHSELAFKKGAKREATALLEEAMESLGIRVPQNWLSLHWRLAVQVAIQLCHSLFPRLLIHRKNSRGTKHDRLAWQMFSRLAHCYWYTRCKSAVLWTHLAGMNAAEAYSPTRQLGQAWSEHGPAVGLIPWYSRGAKYLQKSLKVRKQLNDTWGQGQSRNYLSLLLYSTSRFQRCIKEAQQAEEILLKTGDYWELNIARYHHAASLYRLGRLDESIEKCQKTYEDAFKVGDYQATGNIIDVMSRASLGNIPYDYIETEKNRCLDDAQLRAQLLRAEGVYCIGNNDLDAAIDCFEEAISTVRKAGVWNCYTSGNGVWLATSLRLKSEADERKGISSKLNRRRQFRVARSSLWLAYRFQNDLPHALRELGFAWMHRGNARRARKYFSKSLKFAHRQGARYEAALTQKAFESLDLNAGFRSDKARGDSGEYAVREIESKIRNNSAKRETVSIADRFDVLIDAGRQIATALSKEAIFRETVSAAKQLLRGQQTLIVVPASETGAENDSWKAWNADESFDPSIVASAVSTGKTLLCDSESIHSGGAIEKNDNCSVICCPIVVSGSVTACIYIANRLLKSIYGNEEARIVDFVANAAGSSLEKETSFRELDVLNAHLEEKVWERTRSLRARTTELEQTAQELRATEHSLQQAVDAAEAANQIKSDFLAKMSHEIRTPITAVLGFTQLILRGVITDPDEKRKKIRSIESSGKHLLNLVNDLLDISKIEANKLETEKIECRPLHLLSEVVESLRSKAIENDNELALKLVSPMPTTIQSDPKRLRQVVTNILGNAIKFTSGGDVTLTVTLTDSETPGRSNLTMAVTDSGIGMSPEQVKNVFDPFVQADSSITRRFGGTGLGLSISRKLTQAMGGEIKVSSEEGVGSTFSITIDAGERDSLELLDDDGLEAFMERRVSSDKVSADLSGVHILLADDAETNRDLISLVLCDCGAKVSLAHNGQEAVDLVEEDHSFDLVLMDMQMPILDGYSATKELRKRGYELPVFALTANSMKGDREKCIAAGCSDYLTKPININTLVKTIAKAAGRKVTVIEDDGPQPTVTKKAAASQPVEAAESAKAKMVTAADGLTFCETDIPESGLLKDFSIRFLNTLNERWEEFESGTASENADEIKSLAHWLKGTSGTVTLLSLSETAKQMELAVLDGDWEQVRRLKDQIRRFLSDALDFVMACEV